jgi:hypothetical protein
MEFKILSLQIAFRGLRKGEMTQEVLATDIDISMYSMSSPDKVASKY